jgi:hypothetical protein
MFQSPNAQILIDFEWHLLRLGDAFFICYLDEQLYKVFQIAPYYSNWNDKSSKNFYKPYLLAKMPCPVHMH